MRAICMIGCGPKIDGDLKPVKKTRKQWEAYARKVAARKSKQDDYPWTPFVSGPHEHPVHKHHYRISFAGRPVKV